MQITLEIPEAFAAQITAAGKDPAREALELLAIEGYRTQQLTESQVRRMLGFETRMQVHELLAEHEVCLNYTQEHLGQDIAASNEMHAAWLAKRA
jgi:predicted HTH domain antitoxin